LCKGAVMPVFLNQSDADFEARFSALLGMKREEAEDVDRDVAAIIADVRARGDVAVVELTAKFDHLALTPATLAFSPAEIAAQVAKVSPQDRAALELAAARIRDYHARQLPRDEMWVEEAGAGPPFRRRVCMCQGARPAIPHPC
jgi:histidinol dehydrogenase